MKKVFCVLLSIILSAICVGLPSNIVSAKQLDPNAIVEPNTIGGQCPYYGVHQARVRASASVAEYTDPISNVTTQYNVCEYVCDCGASLICDGEPAWVTGAYMGNYSTDYTLLSKWEGSSYFKINKEPSYSNTVIAGWEFFFLPY